MARTQCNQCGDWLVAPVSSQYDQQQRVKNLWRCSSCDCEFETCVSFQVLLPGEAPPLVKQWSGEPIDGPKAVPITRNKNFRSLQAFVGYRNIDGYLDKLKNNNLSSSVRQTVMQLLVQEADRMGFGEEQLTRAQGWLADCKEHIARLSALPSANPEDEQSRQSMLAAMRMAQKVLEERCERLSADLNWSGH